MILLMPTAKTDREQYDRACRMAANCAKRAQEAKQNNERDFYIKLGDSWTKLANRLAALDHRPTYTP